jgi:hypothetical protein
VTMPDAVTYCPTMSTKGVSNRGGFAGRASAQPEPESPRSTSKSSKSSSSSKAKDVKDAKRPAAPQRPQRQQRAAGAHGAGGAHGAQAAEAAEEGDAAAGAGQVGEVDSGDGLHRRRAHDTESLYETMREEHAEEVDPQETGATGIDSVKRSKGGDSGGSSDGFEQGQQQREAYERMLKGNVKDDQARLAALRAKGLKDAFNPEATAKEVESQGMPRLAGHVVRLYDAWTLQGIDHASAVAKMAAWMAQLSTPQTIRKLLAELESKPIRDVYPLELLMHLLDHRPELLPGVKRGAVLGNSGDLADGKKVFAGHATSVQVPPDTRLKSFALLGGGRPGYEFHPTAGNDTTFTLLIDTPGRWKFAVLAVPLVSLGRIQKEGADSILEIFDVTVHAMGKKGEPMTPEQWWQEQEALAAADGDDDDDAPVSVPDDAPVAEPAPLLILQIRKSLDLIQKDATSSSAATTYSWDVRFFAPGAPMQGDGILHLVVDKAGPFDPVWAKAREAIAHKQKEHEPGRALITQEDVASALRRARVRT